MGKSLTAEQFRMAKGALGISNRELAEMTGLHRNTLNKVDNGDGAASTYNLLRLTFEARGIIFLADGEMVGGGPGVRLTAKSDS